MLGRASENPIFPLNLLADFAGGSLLCSICILSQLFQRSITGKGSIVDINMVQGVQYLGTFTSVVVISCELHCPNRSRKIYNCMCFFFLFICSFVSSGVSPSWTIFWRKRIKFVGWWCSLLRCVQNARYDFKIYNWNNILNLTHD
jgi:hypothetical protein